LTEWFLDIGAGLPYFQQIITVNPNLEDLKLIFLQAILATPGITNVDRINLSLNRITRGLRVDWSATVDGGVKINDSFFIGET
jgi:hypothetical protein